MDTFFFNLTKKLVNECEIHYSIKNLEAFVEYGERVKKEIKEERAEAKDYKIKRQVLVNNLKIISQQIIVRLGSKVEIIKQVEDDNYVQGNGVRNIKCLEFPYMKLIDINALVHKQAEVLETKEEFFRYAHIAEVMIATNGGRIPNSLAGTIRKEISQAYEDDKEFRKVQWACRLNGEKFANFKFYLRGGICLFNKAFKNKIVKNVYYADMTSAYITQLIYQIFPFCIPYEVHTWKLSDDELRDILDNKYYLLCIKAHGLKLKNPNINPLKVEEGEDVIFLTNFDYQILKDTVDCESFEIGELWLFKHLAPLPESIRKIMFGLFADKQDMKSKKGTEAFDEGAYEVYKRRLNCSFGIFGSGIDVSYCNLFWAIYTTAYQRFTLWNNIKENGIENLIYADTDSIFSTEPLNMDEGNELGKWEKGRYKRMIVRGNKGYCLEDYEGHLKLVLSGAAKSGVMRFLKENNITNNKLFSKGYFEKLEIPAKYEVTYRYVATPEEVYKKCYPLKLNRTETIFNIIEDKYNLGEILK